MFQLVGVRDGVEGAVFDAFFAAAGGVRGFGDVFDALVLVQRAFDQGDVFLLVVGEAEVVD